MCGIVGYHGNKNALDVVMKGLEHLEYRGYDSAGIALNVVSEKNTFAVVVEKAVGKLAALREQVAGHSLKATIGMGHTRWATHGAATLDNAHPHRYGRVTLVHNGIFENHDAIREKLLRSGHRFYSNTDSEVAAHLLDNFLANHEPLTALSMLCDTVTGAYALGIMVDGDPKIYFAKHGSPLVVAKGENASFLASDQEALFGQEAAFYTVKDGELGFIEQGNVEVFDLAMKVVSTDWSALSLEKETAHKLSHKHFMHKEIFEQPSTVERVLAGRLSHGELDPASFGLDMARLLKAKKIFIVGCGSAYYAGLMAKARLLASTNLPIEVDIASEFRYRNIAMDAHTLVIAISQSGETIDTLAALKKARSEGALCMSICNVPTSAIATEGRASVGNLFLNAGPEIAVASTKAFLAQVVALKLLALLMGHKLGIMDRAQTKEAAQEFVSLKEKMAPILAQDTAIRTIAETMLDDAAMFFLGRQEYYPTALEGALKMKELAYVFALPYPAGELKHGPIALMQAGMPAIVVFGDDALQVKTLSNLQEVKARGAKVISLTPQATPEIERESAFVIEYGQSAWFGPLLASIPLQLLAYHLSDLKGIDVDKPRNLAKSVTVE